jgi:hypothetical protein
MTSSTLQHVTQLVRDGAHHQETTGEADEDSFQELAGWLSEVLDTENGTDLAEVMAQARASSPAAERYLSRVMRVVGGAQSLTLTAEGPEEWLHLLAIPLFLHPRQHKDVSEVLTHVGCRSEIERSLEHALGLDFASIRLCEHPVSAIELEQLGMVETRRVALDLLNQADSAYLTPPIVDVGASPEAAHHQSLLWPAVWKVRATERDAQMPKIAGALHRSKALSQFKHRADELLERELRDKWGMAVRADIFMPALFHDVTSVFRMVELNLMLNQALHQFKQQCNNVSFGIFGNRLRYALHDTKGLILSTDELRAPEESMEVISQAVRSACARHGVACTVKPKP